MPEPVTSHYRNGWRLFQARPGVFVFSMILLFLSWVALEAAVVALQRLGFLVWLVLHLAWFFVFSGMMTGLHVIALKSVDGKMPQIGDLFGSMALGPGYLIGLCVYAVIVIIGLALLVVPGVYLAVRYALFAQVIADESASTGRALKTAANLASGHWAAVGALFLLAFLVNLGGAALLGIGLLVTFPVSLLAIAEFYRSLRPATP